MKDEKQLIEQLECHRTPAPEGFSRRVIEALPQRHRRVHTLGDWCADFWPSQGRWITPALAGAMATLLIMAGLGRLEAPALSASKKSVVFHFELHAPKASSVELLGTFNSWKSGDIVLEGPDASGHWTASVEIPTGRHEYIFLVDGERWIADPKATTSRPDGFGRVNTVIRVYEEDNA